MRASTAASRQAEWRPTRIARGDLLSQGLRTFYLCGWERWAPNRRELEVAAVLDALEILVFLIVVPIVVFCVLFTLALFGVIGLVFFAAVPVFALMLVLA